MLKIKKLLREDTVIGSALACMVLFGVFVMAMALHNASLIIND